MIVSLSGKVARTTREAIILMVGNVGVEIFAPADVLGRLHPGEQLSLFTYLVVRQDVLALYGFETQEGRDLFGMLLGVNGVGPRLALAILSSLSPEAIRRAIFNEQAEIFARVPGVGRKTAQKVLLHLQDRIKPGLEELEATGRLSDVDSEVLEALTTLGYSVVEAQAAIQNIPRETPGDLETRLRLALSYFSP
jgi:Holliday junction DNA helicase RuvA